MTLESKHRLDFYLSPLLIWGHCSVFLNPRPSSLNCDLIVFSQGFWKNFSSVQFSRSVVSRPPCLSPTPGAYSNSCPMSQWCHPTIPFSVVPFSACLQFFPASGSFQMSRLFTSCGQSIGSFSFSISPSSEYSGLISFRMDWLDLLAVQGTLKSLLQHHSSKASILRHSAFFMVQLSYSYMTTGKAIALTRWTFVGKVMSLLFNMHSRFVIAFLRRSVF